MPDTETTGAPAPTPSPTPAPTPAPAASPAPAPTDGETRGMIPYARLAESQADARSWKTQADELRAKANEADSWKNKYAEREAELTQERASRLEERAFTAAGLTDEEGMDVARMLYGKLKDKPEGGIAAWVADIQSDPAKVPKALAAYFAAPAAEATGARAPVKKPVARSSTSDGPVTVDAMRAAREKAQQSNSAEDWAAFRTLSTTYQAGRKG